MRIDKKHLVAILVVSIVCNLFLLTHYLDHRSSIHVRSSPEDYPLLSKRIFTQDPNDIIINFVALRKALREYVNAEKGDLGVYFEYLPSGISIGVNDTEEVRLASLSKVPLVMSILKKVERGQITLEDTLVIKRENLDKKFGTLWQKGEGTKLTIRELIDYALIESDNTAADTLLTSLTPKEINEVYDNLEIELQQNLGEFVVTPKAYSSIFRSLYLASYLSEEYSQYVLEVLTKTKFNDKISARIPKEIPVSHKIGVFSVLNSPENVFTDCGIIYVPGRPYILCIFAQGSEEEARKHMSLVSYMVYSYLNMVKGGVE